MLIYSLSAAWLGRGSDFTFVYQDNNNRAQQGSPHGMTSSRTAGPDMYCTYTVQHGTNNTCTVIEPHTVNFDLGTLKYVLFF
jgi:hypothetical protein